MVIVQTCMRQGVSYLADTLRSIGDVETRRKFIVSDGPLPSVFDRPDGWTLIQFNWRGARLTGWACLNFALDYGAEDLILLQDDIVLCEGGADVIDRCPVPDNCIATLFYSGSPLPDLQPKAPGDPRFIVMGAGGTAQAMKIPRRSLQYLATCNPNGAPNHIPPGPHLFDDVLFAFARESPWKHVAHLVPNVVRHIGAISACGTTRAFNQPWSVRRGETFQGDVMNLPVHEVRYK